MISLQLQFVEIQFNYIEHQHSSTTATTTTWSVLWTLVLGKCVAATTLLNTLSWLLLISSPMSDDMIIIDCDLRWFWIRSQKRGRCYPIFMDWCCRNSKVQRASQWRDYSTALQWSTDCSSTALHCTTYCSSAAAANCRKNAAALAEQLNSCCINTLWSTWESLHLPRGVVSENRPGKLLKPGNRLVFCIGLWSVLKWIYGGWKESGQALLRLTSKCLSWVGQSKPKESRACHVHHHLSGWPQAWVLPAHACQDDLSQADGVYSWSIDRSCRFFAPLFGH